MISTNFTPPPFSAPAVRAGVVVKNERVAPAVLRLRLRFAPPPVAAPGQFLHLLCDTFADDVAGLTPHEDRGPGAWSLQGFELSGAHPFLRRPLSISRTFDDGLEIIFQVLDAGLGTTRLAGLEPGQNVDCLGPLGHGYAFHDDLRVAMLVGGGVGITPMIATGDWLVSHGVRCHAIAAARHRALIALELVGSDAATRAVDFDNVGVPVEFATDDGSLGHHGVVTELLATRLADLRDEAGVEVFACGPRPMLAAVARLAAECGRPCQVLMEEVMGCGIGVCLACVTKVTAPGEPGYTYQRICTEGPAFDAARVLWT